MKRPTVASHRASAATRHMLFLIGCVERQLVTIRTMADELMSRADMEEQQSNAGPV